MIDPFLTRLEATYPGIRWREPIAVLVNPNATGEQHYGCRVCIAAIGLRGADVPELPVELDRVKQHITKEHLEWQG